MNQYLGMIVFELEELSGIPYDYSIAHNYKSSIYYIYQSDLKDQLFCLSIYILLRNNMSKVLKRQKSPLKFDTSSANIDCFIRGKSKHKNIQNDAYIINASKRKRTLKYERQKHIQFQDKAFLESVVCKILNDADCKGIAQLIDSMDFTVNKPSQKLTNKANYYEQHVQEQINHIFSDAQSFNNNHQSNHANICRQNGQIYKINPIFTNFTIKNPQQKYQCKTAFESSFITSPRSQINPQFSAHFAPVTTIGYGFNYYTPNNYYYSRQLRKKKNNQVEQVNEFKIIPQKIDSDGRTTLMVRHIPNKYSEEILYQELERNHKMKINFLYLPIDHYNSCNVGYAFVNFIHTKFIYDFYKQFSHRRWDKFNSEKICELAYARIQGATNLMDHFHGNYSRGKIISKTEEKKSKSSLQVSQFTLTDICKTVDFPKVEDP